MKITFVLPHASICGGMRVIAIHAAGLQRRGHKVFAISQPQRPPALRSRMKGLLRGDWVDPLPSMTKGFFEGFQGDHVVLKRPRPVTDADVPEGDVVIATWWETAEWAAALSARKGVKTHLIQHHEVSEVWPGIPDDRAMAVWSLPFHRMAVSQWLATIGAERYGQRYIDLIPNAVDHDLFSAPPRNRGDSPCVGFMYSSLRMKGSDIAVAAAAELRKRLPDLRVIAFGSGANPGPNILPPWIEYRCNPAQTALASLYSACGVWLFPSRLEGFGLPILEAMACRTPVVATPAGAAPELVEHGGGVLVPHEDPLGMAEAVTGLLICPAREWRTASDLAFSIAARYTWERSTDLLEQSLLRALSARREPSGLGGTAP